MAYTRWYISRWEAREKERCPAGLWALKAECDKNPLKKGEGPVKCRSIGKDYNGYAVCKVFGEARHHDAFLSAGETYAFGGESMSDSKDLLDSEIKLVVAVDKEAVTIEDVVNGVIKGTGDTVNTVSKAIWA